MKNILIISILFLTGIACSKDGDINFFSVAQDKQFGEQLDSAILANPAEYPILDKTANPEAYAFIEGMMNDILTNDEILYRDEFEWQVRIINSDVKNAFAAPGGKLYFYTGLINYLENSAQLAGVMAHEIAHADRRHSTEQLTKAYGFSILLSIVLGNNDSKLTEIAAQLAQGAASLKFSRDDEYEADKYAVIYSSKSPKDYDPRGIKGFFEKLREDGHTQETFTFLSTHPDDADRLVKIDEEWGKIGSPDGETFEAEYTAFKSSLP